MQGNIIQKSNFFVFINQVNKSTSSLKIRSEDSIDDRDLVNQLKGRLWRRKESKKRKHSNQRAEEADEPFLTEEEISMISPKKSKTKESTSSEPKETPAIKTTQSEDNDITSC